MTKPKYNKFNTGRTKGYFPLKRWRFDTEQHPVLQSKRKCASSTAKTRQYARTANAARIDKYTSVQRA